MASPRPARRAAGPRHADERQATGTGRIGPCARERCRHLANRNPRPARRLRDRGARSGRLARPRGLRIRSGGRPDRVPRQTATSLPEIGRPVTSIPRSVDEPGGRRRCRPAYEPRSAALASLQAARDVAPEPFRRVPGASERLGGLSRSASSTRTPPRFRLVIHGRASFCPHGIYTKRHSSQDEHIL